MYESRFSYAENESSHTDTDDILDAEEDYTMQEEEYKDKIEFVLDKRVCIFEIKVLY